MSGLILLFILCAWGAASFFLAKILTTPAKNSNAKTGANIILAAIFFIAPLTDEIIGGFQFRRLCSDRTAITFDEKTIKGKTVISKGVESLNINNYMVPIVEKKRLFKDVNSETILISWNEFHAQGGWLSRYLNILSTTEPYLFDGACISPKWKNSIFSDLEITEVRQ